MLSYEYEFGPSPSSRYSAAAWVGYPKIQHPLHERVVRVQASDDELTWIRSNLIGIPMHPGNVVTWNDPYTAQFIFDAFVQGALK